MNSLNFANRGRKLVESEKGKEFLIILVLGFFQPQLNPDDQCKPCFLPRCDEHIPINTTGHLGDVRPNH